MNRGMTITKETYGDVHTAEKTYTCIACGEEIHVRIQLMWHDMQTDQQRGFTMSRLQTITNHIASHLEAPC